MKSLRESTIFKNWLIFFFCATAGGVLLAVVVGGIVGGVIGGCLGAQHMPMEKIQETVRPIGFVLGLISATLMSYICYRWTTGRLLKAFADQSTVVPVAENKPL